MTGFGGEQFALPEAVESLRAFRSRQSQEAVTVAGAWSVFNVLVAAKEFVVPSLMAQSIVRLNDSSPFVGSPLPGLKL